MNPMLDQYFADAKTALARMQPGRTPAEPDSDYPSSVLDYTYVVGRTPLVFLRNDLTESTWLRLPDQKRSEILRHFTKLSRTEHDLAETGGINLSRHNFGSGSNPLIAPLVDTSGRAQLVALLMPRATSMQQACELAREVLEAFVLLEPVFNATPLGRGRILYYEGNLRAGLPGFLRMFP